MAQPELDLVERPDYAGRLPSHRRYRYNDRAGHIGYGIRPSARGRGIAT